MSHWAMLYEFGGGCKVLEVEARQSLTPAAESVIIFPASQLPDVPCGLDVVIFKGKNFDMMQWMKRDE